jgi:hypothetical protein
MLLWLISRKLKAKFKPNQPATRPGSPCSLVLDDDYIGHDAADWLALPHVFFQFLFLPLVGDTCEVPFLLSLFSSYFLFYESNILCVQVLYKSGGLCSSCWLHRVDWCLVYVELLLLCWILTSPLFFRLVQWWAHHCKLPFLFLPGLPALGICISLKIRIRYLRCRVSKSPVKIICVCHAHVQALSIACTLLTTHPSSGCLIISLIPFLQ